MLVLCVLISRLSFVSVFNCIHYQCLFLINYPATMYSTQLMHSTQLNSTHVFNSTQLMHSTQLNSCIQLNSTHVLVNKDCHQTLRINRQSVYVPCGSTMQCGAERRLMCTPGATCCLRFCEFDSADIHDIGLA